MWTTSILAIALSLAQGQGGDLTLSNDRLTYGPLGPVRPDSRFLPGDVLSLSFDIENLRFDANGRGSYSIGMEVLDSKGQNHLRQEPRTMQALNYLGGTSLPAVAHAQVGLEQPTGSYTLKITVTDQSSKSSKTLERKFEVAPLAFGLVQVGLSVDPEGAIPALPLAAVGQSAFLNFSAVGFGRDRTTRQPKLAVEMRVLNDGGLPTFAKPITGEANTGIPDNVKLVPMQFGLSLNRAGKFNIELKATDQVSGKSATVSLPIQVVAGK